MPRGQPRWEKRLRGILACAVDRRRSATTRRLVLSLPAAFKDVLTHDDDVAVTRAVRASRDLRLMLIGFVSAMTASVKRRDAYFPGHADVEIASLLQNEASASFDADQSALMRAESAAAKRARSSTNVGDGSAPPRAAKAVAPTDAAVAGAIAVARMPSDADEAVCIDGGGACTATAAAAAAAVAAVVVSPCIVAAVPANNTANVTRHALRVHCTPEETARFELLASTGRKLWDPPVRASQDARPPRSPAVERPDLRNDDARGHDEDFDTDGNGDRGRKRALCNDDDDDDDDARADPDLGPRRSPALAAPRIPMPRPSQTPMFSENAACSQATPSDALPVVSTSLLEPTADANASEQAITSRDTPRNRHIGSQASVGASRKLRLTVVS
jgi:hypothetical protein